MILLNGNNYELHKEIMKISTNDVIKSIEKHDFQELFTTEIDVKPDPVAYPCFVESVISIERIYQHGLQLNELNKFTLVISNGFIYKSLAKQLVYPKVRNLPQYNMHLLKTHNELLECLNTYSELVPKSNALDLKEQAAAGLYKFPVLMWWRTYSRGIRYDPLLHNYNIRDTLYKFNVFDTKQAKQLVYALKEEEKKRENAKRLSKPPKVGVYKITN